VTDPSRPVDPDDERGFIEQVLRALDGQLRPEERAAFTSRLSDDVDKRRQFVQICLHSCALSEVLSLSQQTAAEPVRAAPGDGPPTRQRWKSWLPWMVAAAACLVAMLSWVAPRNPAQRARPVDRAVKETAPPRPLEHPEVVALLVNEADARFAAGLAPEGVRFGVGTYRLTAGAVHLRFSSGADVVMSAPARFSVDGPLALTLAEGNLRAIVPEPAHGFTVKAPGVDYEDLGTEFGVAVGANHAVSEVHVFEGRVDVKTPAGVRMSSVELGESVRVTNGKVGPVGESDADRFPTIGSIHLQHWQGFQQTLQADPTLVHYYPFVEDREDDHLLRDRADRGTPAHGRIHNARWVSGRWPGKQALLFDGDGDRVELLVPGQFRQLTLAAWVKVDRFDYEFATILNSDAREPGNIQWQLSRSGGFWMAVSKFSLKRRRIAGGDVPMGRWVHVAMVVDADHQRVESYLDGQLADEAKSAPVDIPLVPGPCHMGEWWHQIKSTPLPKRGFRGRIDELAIWKRALGPDEIRELAASGRPTLLNAVAPARS
jgi:hypothetical protein